jgi:hypothetical protein
VPILATAAFLAVSVLRKKMGSKNGFLKNKPLSESRPALTDRHITMKRARKEDKTTGVGEDTDKTTVHTIDGSSV